MGRWEVETPLADAGEMDRCLGDGQMSCRRRAVGTPAGWWVPGCVVG